MKKKILSIFLSLCLMVTSLFTLSGCDLLHDNDKKYYAEVVATVGDKTITRNEVLTMFNYYYYTMGYYQYGYSQEVVFQMVIEALVKNKIMSLEAQNIEECKLTEADEYYIWEQVFNNINSQIDTHETEIKKLFGIEVEEEKESTEEDLPTFSEYDGRVKPSAEIDNATVSKTKAEWLETLTSETNKETNYYRYLAYKKYISELEKSAKKYQRGNKSEAQLLEDEVTRLYDYYKESRYVSKYNVYMTNKITVSNDEIYSEYLKSLNAQTQELSVAGAYGDKVVDTSNKDLILYRQNGNYFTVQHILLQFADFDSELKASSFLYNLDNYVSSYDSNKNLEQTFIDQYLDEREDYALHIEDSLNMDYINPKTGETNKDDNGNEEKYTLESFDDLINGTEGIYTKYKNDEITKEQMAKEFFKYKFSFSKDSGVTDLTSLVNLMGYSLPTNKADGNSFVTEFADTCYDLYEQYQTDGSYGIERVVTNFGVHYIMFTGVMSAGTLSLDDKFTLVSDQKVSDYFHDSLISDKESSVTADIGSVLYNQYFNAGKIEIKYDNYEDCL